MKQYKVWIHVEEIDEDRDIYEDIGECYSAGSFETEATARNYIEDELLTTHISGSAADLLDACKELTSFVCDILYRTDNQVNLDEFEEIRKAREAISNYRPVEAAGGAVVSQMKLEEQSTQSPSMSIPLKLLNQDGQLRIQPEGFGEKCAADGAGSPVGMEVWRGRLRLVVFDDINTEEPKIIDLENARESARK